MVLWARQARGISTHGILIKHPDPANIMWAAPSLFPPCPLIPLVQNADWIMQVRCGGYKVESVQFPSLEVYEQIETLNTTKHHYIRASCKQELTKWLAAHRVSPPTRQSSSSLLLSWTLRRLGFCPNTMNPLSSSSSSSGSPSTNSASAPSGLNSSGLTRQNYYAGCRDGRMVYQRPLSCRWLI